jgi:hypothetical protein
LPVLSTTYAQKVGACDGFRMKCEFIKFGEYFNNHLMFRSYPYFIGVMKRMKDRLFELQRRYIALTEYEQYSGNWPNDSQRNCYNIFVKC